MDRRQKIGVFMPTWLGDSCMATPTLRAIGRAFPEASIVAICRPVVASLLADLKDQAGRCLVSETVLFNKSSSFSRFQLATQIRRCRLSSIILLPNSWWTAAVSRLAGVKTIVGYNRDARGWLLTNAVPLPKAMNDQARGEKVANGKMPISPVDYYLRLAEWLGCDVADKKMSLGLSEADRCSASELWAELHWSEGTPTLVINNNAATEVNRMWPADRVLGLAKYVAETHKWQVLLHCGPSEMDAANAIAERACNPLIGSMAVAGSLPIGLTKAVMHAASAVVSTDSGPRHIAVAMNRPVVSLFAAIDPAWTTTYNIPEQIVQPTRSASEMQMQGIELEAVISSVETVMRSVRAAA